MEMPFKISGENVDWLFNECGWEIRNWKKYKIEPLPHIIHKEVNFWWEKEKLRWEYFKIYL